MLDFLTQDITLWDYPIPTLIHWCQGLLVGWLCGKSHFHQRWHLLGYAGIATLCFVVYEALEQARIGDKGDVDVLNFAMMVHLAALVTVLYHLLKRRLTHGHRKTG